MIQKLLSNLLIEFPFSFEKILTTDPLVTGITSDSRLITQGSLFVAISGDSVDGHQYISSAINKGAVAVVGENIQTDLPVPYIQVENSRQSLAFLAASLYDYPARKLTMIGVTGTDGKTTTSNILYQILLATGIKVGLISTVNAVIGTDILDTGFHVTTPDAPDVQKYLARMVNAGLTHVILETTSHGWAQYRVDACEFDIGVVTNITHEHLDYHGSYVNYRAAKARLFSCLKDTLPKESGSFRIAVLNQDDISYTFLNEFSETEMVSYGCTNSADVWADEITQTLKGIRFTVHWNDNSFSVKTGMFGLYNVYNCLAAITAALIGLHIAPQDIVKGIANLSGVPGRMERIELGQNFIAFVDFAHTPNALRVTLETARQLLDGLIPASPTAKHRVIAVFGSAGLRDKEKRRMMAEISIELADLSILTAEDPRTESLDDILQEMAMGAISKGAQENITFWRVKDRGNALRLAVSLAKPGDIVISCGKGHEQSMCFGSTEYLWDDRIALRAAISEKLGLSGTTMPYLPTQDQS